MTRKKSGARYKRHCMIVHAFYPVGETRVQREAEALVKRGYEVDVLCLKRNGDRYLDYFNGVRIIRIPFTRYIIKSLMGQLLEYLVSFFIFMFQVSRLHMQRRYKTVQVHNPPDFLIFTAWLPRMMGARLILDLHDPMPEFYASKFDKAPESLIVRYLSWQERVSCRFAHLVVAVSHQWKRIHVSRGVPKDKVFVVMNLADESIFYSTAQPDAPPMKNGKLRLIYHGTVVHRYGLDLVLDALAGLPVNEVLLTIVGNGEDMKALIRKADKLNIKEKVEFSLNFKPAEELPEILLNADVGIVPYRNDPYTDKIVPTKLLEYAALEIPCIAARTDAISHYFDETMVEFFPPGNVEELGRCILKLYRNPDRLAELRKGMLQFLSLIHI